MVTRVRLVRVALAGLTLVLGAGLASSISPSHAGGFPALYVTFAADHTFAVKLADGTPVGTTGAPGAPIPAGAYQLYLNDASGAVMQFDLAGPGVSLVENMTNSEEMAASYVETFQPNSTYTYRDDYRPGVVWTFATTATVLSSAGTTATGTTTSPAGTTPPSSPPGANSSPSTTDLVGSGLRAAPLRGMLAAAVSSAGKLTLTQNGASISRLRSGRYTVVVTDRSSRAGFWLDQAGQPPVALTGTSFAGRRSVTVDLKPGRWFFFPSFVGTKSYFTVVS